MQVPGPSCCEGMGVPAQHTRADQGLALVVGFVWSSTRAPRGAPPCDYV
jgi:hypothetical protein